MAGCLVKILENDLLREKLGAGGRETALQFSPEKIADRWEAIYRSAIDQYGKKL